MMNKNSAVLLILILAPLLASGCMYQNTMYPVTRSGQGPIEVRYAMDAESMEYDMVSDLWNVTFSMTVSLTNLNKKNPAEIGTVNAAVWPSFEQGHRGFPTIYETIGFFTVLGPNQSATKQKTFSKTFTTDELSAFTEYDYDVIITVPGYYTTNESRLDGDRSPRGYPLQVTPRPLTTRSPSPSPSRTMQGVPFPTPRGTSTQPSSSPAAGRKLVWYDFEDNSIEGNIVYDRSGNGNDAYLNGNLITVEGIVGKQALEFDGSSYLLAQDNPAAHRKNVTFSFWFRTENPDNNYKMASAAWWNGGPGSGWTMATHIPEFWAEDTRGVCLPDLPNLDNHFLRGQWNFEVVTYDGHSIREYTNGQLINTWPTREVPLGEGSPMAIGAWPGVGFYFTGSIDEFIIYDYPLTGQEISALYSP
ncbi:MAG: LamG domain-containing protein [Methanoregula sp.]|nr:LamG domain-containing protein [Methanoregula sp.]